MSLDISTVRRVAQLARIEIDEDQLNVTAEELNNIFSWIQQLEEVETGGVEPLASVTGHKLPMRPDSVSDGGYPEKVLDNAPDRAENFFAVPKVVE
ncbi:MAG: Asp-tRNA(Asn)/Glu-tRNA(Gln) amidotransferase GatCAB subunit C [Rhodospirillaceae bacterium]|nr:Asp-tRNA(Asn)/Glu-tRNA(Gln) amidotransferase GatCAB subunit C [Rhodospirillaceae bacterium]|tara:strand:+ start:1181 stop:1468 length:288 start_codon:yes stop_codon:yes gene_type:complete